jgi:outer membrane protein
MSLPSTRCDDQPRLRAILQCNIDRDQIAPRNPKVSEKLQKIARNQSAAAAKRQSAPGRRHHEESVWCGPGGNGRQTMRKTTIIAAIAAATMLSSPALAGSQDGRWQIKVLATGVLPDGKITEIRSNAIGLPAGSQTKANDNVVPTLAVEYFFNPSVSVETICCLTNHRVSGAGAIAGTQIVDHVLILPATVTLKYHLNAGGGDTPYIGAGPTVFFYLNEKPGATTRALGGASLNLENKIGAVVQAGIDIPVNDNGLGISLDGKKYFVNTVLHVRNAAGAEVLRTEHRISPWVISAGVSYRF